MKITKYGHSCLHVSHDAASILIDPGTLSAGFESLTGLTAVLITHQHPDHIDVAQLGAVLSRNPGVPVYADPQTTGELTESGVKATSATAGDLLDVGTSVEIVGRDHASIHRDVPTVANVGYLVAGRLFHPGDALTVPDRKVEVLALPVAAPWMALKEAVDFVRAVQPAVAVPIHDRVLATTTLYYSLLSRLAPAQTTWTDLDDGHTEDV